MKIVHIEESQATLDPQLQNHLEGDVRIQRLFSAQETNGKDILMVFFGPGGRTAPHVHQQGQILHITYGTGVVDIEEEQRIVKAGDVVIIPPGAWHWHGATQGTAMQHLAYQSPEQSDINWDVPLRDWSVSYSKM